MGKYLKIIALAIIFAFGSCDKSETEPQLPSIIGTWEEVKIETNEYVTGKVTIDWTFLPSKTASQTVSFVFNGVEMRRYTFQYDYRYERLGWITLTNTEKGNSFDYRIEVEGDYMRLGSQKDGFFNLTRKY